MKKVTNLLEKTILSYFPYLEINVNNCPESLWEQKFGGYYYWQQVFHAIASTIGMLSDRIPLPEDSGCPIPMGYAFFDADFGAQMGFPTDGPYTGPRNKEIMLKLMEVAKTQVHRYFETLDDATLLEEIEWGQKMTVLEKIELVSSHIMYHIGAFDAALRDHGAEASM